MKRLQERMFQDQQKTYEQNMTQLLERMEKEQERAREDNKQVLDAKLKVRMDRHLHYQNASLTFIHTHLKKMTVLLRNIERNVSNIILWLG